MPTTIYFNDLLDNNARSGIDITYTQCTEELSIGGWYDSCVGIMNQKIKLIDFLKKLKVKKKTLQKILQQYD
ncbi:MAG TPA: hypothetical protein PLJ37_00650 [Chitinophagales bacterium]|nr:hypothetical protein [Chitinophagales bacterium]HMW93460.1 hypothetical protein [Chitinophagales bacterium]HMZ92917.1 hypothetical protein [Chitinophagales bacterium]HNG25894.1 hypothetical protein [Chitinophagales bacterium]